MINSNTRRYAGGKHALHTSRCYFHAVGSVITVSSSKLYLRETKVPVVLLFVDYHGVVAAIGRRQRKSGIKFTGPYAILI